MLEKVNLTIKCPTALAQSWLGHGRPVDPGFAGRSETPASLVCVADARLPRWEGQVEQPMPTIREIYTSVPSLAVVGSAVPEIRAAVKRGNPVLGLLWLPLGYTLTDCFWIHRPDGHDIRAGESAWTDRSVRIHGGRQNSAIHPDTCGSTTVRTTKPGYDQATM